MFLADSFVDVFLIYKNVGALDRVSPPGGMGLYKILGEIRLPFVTFFDIMAIHPSSQVSVTKALHERIHLGLAQPSIMKLCRYLNLDGLGIPCR